MEKEKENEQRKQQTALVRQQFPQCVAFADAMREVFGAGVRMTYAEENGRAIGHKIDMARGKWVSVADMELDVKKQPESDNNAPKKWNGYC